MTIIQSIVLGIIQGLTEFLPVSSSGHLVVFPLLFGWREQPLAFDTTLHLGTSLALIVYFFKDLKKIVTGLFKDVAKHKEKVESYSLDSTLGIYLIAGTVPAAIVGLLFGDFIENTFRSVFWVSMTLILGSALIYLAEKYYKSNLPEVDNNLSTQKSFKIGWFQCLALLPGISRSGSTISGGLFQGLDREGATRFSFLLSLPVILLAGLFQIPHSLSSLETIGTVNLITGFLTSAGTGYFAVRFLLGFVKKHDLKPFIIYRLVLAAVLLVFAFIK